MEATAGAVDAQGRVQVLQELFPHVDRDLLVDLLATGATFDAIVDQALQLFPPPPSLPAEGSVGAGAPREVEELRLGEPISSEDGALPSGSPHLKRKAAGDLSEQLKECRRQRKEQWRKQRSSPNQNQTPPQQSRGFDVGIWRQLKDLRTKQHDKWHRSSHRRMVMGLADLNDSNGQESTVSQGGGTAEEKIGKTCLLLTNKFRKQQGLIPLLWEDALYKVALQHSHNMGLGRVAFGHDGFRERMQEVPYRPGFMAENVAYSQGVRDVADTAVNGWIRSPGHRKNLLSLSARRCAIAVYRNASGRHYLTQLFSD